MRFSRFLKDDLPKGIRSRMSKICLWQWLSGEYACKHANLQQIKLARREWPSPHPPCSEIWTVECPDCGKRYEEAFIGD